MRQLGKIRLAWDAVFQCVMVGAAVEKALSARIRWRALTALDVKFSEAISSSPVTCAHAKGGSPAFPIRSQQHIVKTKRTGAARPRKHTTEAFSKVSPLHQPGGSSPSG